LEGEPVRILNNEMMNTQEDSELFSQHAQDYARGT
jgi:hypothetical protein